MSQREYERWRDDYLWRPSHAAGLEIADDTSPADWIGEHLHPRSFQVEMTVPDCFESYARIFFPFVGDTIYDDQGRGIDTQRITWTETANRNNKVPHALMEAETIFAPEGHSHGSAPLYGGFSEEQDSALWPMLKRHTASTHGWFLLWDGFGDVDPRPFEAHPKVIHDARSYYLLHGPLDATHEIANQPSYTWPDDRSWCLCTDVDFYWAYLAGSSDCVSETVATPILDAYPTSPTNPARSGMDTINDPSGSVPRRL